MNRYLSTLAAWASDHREELERDQVEARSTRDRLQRQLDTVERRLALLSSLASLSTLPDGAQPEGEAQRLSLHDAMAEVLKSAPERMMRARDLAAEIDRRGLYRMRDGRPVEPQQIHARTGNYPHLFERKGTFIRLK